MVIAVDLKALNKLCFLYRTLSTGWQRNKIKNQESRMHSVRIKCSANMAGSCTSIQSCVELMRRPSCSMTWRANMFLLPEVRLEKERRKYVATKIPEGQKSISPSKRGKADKKSSLILLKNKP